MTDSDSEEITVTLPKGVKFRKGCMECKKKGFICATNELGSDICLQPIYKVMKDDTIELFDIYPCRYSKDGKIKVNLK